MGTLEWDNMEVKIDCWRLRHLRFANDIVLVKPNTSQAERMLDDFDKACGKIGLRLNLARTMFMVNGLTLNRTNISEWCSYVYLGREINIINDLASKLSRRKRSASGA
ncbi:unnamed protein product [Angiostrongylus costaricensis]|uniref:Reverse transcriptase domain-containing protein n=1 Tax=Angiostrongylus costaricensis TaxID=334426 RepID=A0A0R3PHJ5_ANGCS|nr:unnamed protein product [Angiostrongylus costaricensis]